MNDIAKAILSLNEKNNNNYQFHMKANVSSEQEYNDNVDFITGGDENNLAIISDTQLYTWAEIQTELPLTRFDSAMEDLRSKRNELLTETDYIVIKAKETGTTIPTAWKTYRQALRDITENLTTVDEIEAVVFPTKP